MWKHLLLVRAKLILLRTELYVEHWVLRESQYSHLKWGQQCGMCNPENIEESSKNVSKGHRDHLHSKNIWLWMADLF